MFSESEPLILTHFLCRENGLFFVTQIITPQKHQAMCLIRYLSHFHTILWVTRDDDMEIYGKRKSLGEEALPHRPSPPLSRHVAEVSFLETVMNLEE